MPCLVCAFFLMCCRWTELPQALLGAIGVGEQSATVIGATFQVDFSTSLQMFSLQMHI